MNVVNKKRGQQRHIKRTKFLNIIKIWGYLAVLLLYCCFSSALSGAVLRYSIDNLRAERTFIIAITITIPHHLSKSVTMSTQTRSRSFRFPLRRCWRNFGYRPLGSESGADGGNMFSRPSMSPKRNRSPTP